MAKYQFTALALDGTRVVGVEDAPSLRDVHSLLSERELVPIKVAAKKSIFQYEITKKKVKPRELMHFSRQLGVFIKAGIPIVSALVYPGIVLALGAVVVTILTVFVLPQFEDFFKGFNAKLPLATRMLLSFTRFMTSWGLLIVLGVGVFLVGAGMYFRSSGGKPKRDALLLKIPVLGDLISLAIVERFCRILSSMLTAGVPVPEALAVTGDATNNAVFQEKLTIAREAMIRGEGLAAPLNATELFPTSARQMFRVGEDTGTLDQQMHTAAVYFDRELDYKIKRFTTLFEPAVIIFIGIVVGFVAIALVSAMYGIYRQVPA